MVISESQRSSWIVNIWEVEVGMYIGIVYTFYYEVLDRESDVASRIRRLCTI